MENVRLIAGRSNRPLAEGISKVLGIDLVDCIIEAFPNTELRVEINEDIRGKIVFIVQTGGSNEISSINDYVMETLLLVDACRKSDARKVNVILANFPYSRSDKKDKPRVPIAAKMVARMLETVGANRIICMDLHAGQEQGFADVPFDNLYAIRMHIDNLERNVFCSHNRNEFVLVSLDVGGSKRIKEYAEKLKMPYAVMDKQRDYSKPGTVVKSSLIGNVSGKVAICIDDMIDTAGTLTSGINDLQNHGAHSAIILVTHPIFSGPAADRLNKCDFIEKVIVVNTLDQTENLKKIPKLEVLDASPLFSEVIRRIVCGGSLSALFK